MADFFAHETAIIDAGAEIGEGSRIWHWVHVCGGAKIGKGVSLGQNVFVGNRVVIGDRCKIQNNVSVYEGVVLEDYTFCGPSAVFTNVKTPRSAFARNTSDDYEKTIVRYGASIGANATIVCGTAIGRWALVAAGSVVTKDVPAYAVVAGVPARVMGWACECGAGLDFEGDRAVCGDCGRSYRRLDPVTVELEPGREETA